MKESSIAYHGKKTALHSLAALLLAFCLLLPAGLIQASEAQPLGNLFGSKLADSDDNIRSLASVGDTLYIRTIRALYSYKPGDPEVVLLSSFEDDYDSFVMLSEDAEREPVAAHIFSDGERLLALDSTAQTVYTLSFADGKLAFTEPLKLDMAEFVQGEAPYIYVQEANWMQVVGGRLYMKMQNYEDKEVDLYSFDLKTGEKKTHAPTHLASASPYKDGLLIAALSNPNDMYDYETGTPKKPQLVVFNPQDDSVTELGAYQPSAEYFGSTNPIWYDAQADALFTYTDTDVYRLEGDMKTPRLIGYLPMFGQNWPVSNGLQPLSDGRLAIAFGQNIFLRERTEKGLEGYTVLSMAGGLDDPSVLSRVLMEMDKVVLRRVEGLEYNWINAEQLASMFLTGNVNVDLMSINAYGFDLDKLIQKGYLADLSSNPAVAAYLASLFPNLSDPVMEDGKIYGVPYNLMMFPLHAYLKPFAELDLEIPTSIMGLLDLAQRWVEDLAEEHPDYILFSDGGNIKATLRRLVIDRYVADTLGAGKELKLDTPLFRELMTRVEGMNYGDWGRDLDWETEEGRSAMEEMWNKQTLIESGMGYEPSYSVELYQSAERPMRVMLLPLEDGGQAYAETDYNLLVMLSSSKNQEVGKEFMAHYIDKMNPVIKAALSPAAKEPIPNPRYETEKASQERNLKRMEAQYEKAEGAQKSDLEEGLKYFRQYVQEYLEKGKYLATERDLANFHAVYGSTFVFTGLGNAQRQALWSNYELQQQFFDGAISLDQFIKQLDDTLRLVRMEYQ